MKFEIKRQTLNMFQLHKKSWEHIKVIYKVVKTQGSHLVFGKNTR
jgi:hypothetical protein